VADAWDFDTLTFEQVTADYGRRRVLSRVAFACARGSITGLVGPNGAGKTTLLTIASTRGRPSSGRMRYGEATIGAGALVRGRIGFLGHDPGLYPELTARENLRFFADLHGLVDPAGKVAAALERAQLVDRADEPVGGFSRGMRQRIGLERVLLHEPRLVLLDEPFTGLDEVSSRALLARLAGLKDRGCIVLLSTHDLDLAAPLLDRAIVLREGRVVAELESTAELPAAVRCALEGAASHGLKPMGDNKGAGSERRQEAAALSRAESDAIGPGIRTFVRAAAVVARKDLVVEFRSRELFLTTLFFALSTVLVFSFAFVREGRPLADAAAGILWVATSFAGVLALGRTFEREQSHHTLPALLQAPVDRAAIYVGKLGGLLGLSWLVLLAIVPLVGLLFQATIAAHPFWMLAFLATGSLGFLAVGSLFAAMLVRTRSRDVLLPVLLFPMTVPVLLAGVRGTSALLQATPDLAIARLWLMMLLFFDAVFVTLALWTFDAVTSE
jgi:heme exporter protein CcmB